MNEYELSFLDVLATSNIEVTRFRRNGDKSDYLTTLNDLDSRLSDAFTSLATIPDKINVLNESYNSFELFLDDLEEAALGELSFVIWLIVNKFLF